MFANWTRKLIILVVRQVVVGVLSEEEVILISPSGAESYSHTHALCTTDEWGISHIHGLISVKERLIDYY